MFTGYHQTTAPAAGQYPKWDNIVVSRNSIGPTSQPQTCYDVDNDNIVNIKDLALVIFWQGKNYGQGDWQNYDHLDVNSDNAVNFSDVSLIMANMGQSC